MSEIDKLREKIQNIRMKIEKMHVTAWRHRVNKDIDLMRAVHRRIKAAKKRITDCEWMLDGLHVESWLPKAIASWFVFQIVVISYLGTEVLFAFIQTFVCLRFNCILPWFSKGDVE